ncbi:hypothetical protein PYCCODRAFT_1434526 [Trametes coccinea BRFM310]|uniref:Uncharacterized protein n=1 Tax=Trametes coccinea (strain BRFM310) TaxID=1353009 RepID=A0A1Y2IUJ1_TRAC3|nr:hypothetical protein PYCCODRAFT_1434526 [Trametes coccinea BRFM310]
MSSYTVSPVEYSSYPAQTYYPGQYDGQVVMSAPYQIHAPRPQLQISTQYSAPCLPSDDYLVREFFTPSPTSSCPSDHASSSLPSAQEGPQAAPVRKRSTASLSRKDERIRGTEQSPTEDGLVVRGAVAHPYARLYNRKQAAGKRRKMWNHALEKMLFTPQEISTMGAPHRRTIYTASLEAHVDRLHEQLLGLSLFPVPFEKLEPYRGLNSKTAKSMVSGLHHDAAELKLKIRELERANRDLEDRLSSPSLTGSYKSCL